MLKTMYCFFNRSTLRTIKKHAGERRNYGLENQTLSWGGAFSENEDVGALVLFVRRKDLFFVVAPLGVDFPGVEVWRILAEVPGISMGDSGRLHHMDFQAL